ncbi:MAG: cytochrome-c oxidase, cbb3-type subunit III [Ahniella sp.]|nr:cytochrome-c oxidase, cbb3-type subunit III [Ahniella sp.]
MTGFWSIYIAAFVVLNIIGCVGLLWYTAHRRANKVNQAETTGHVWDGNLTELNKPLPRWWINLFYLTIVFSIGYMVIYPGFGSFAGTKAWSSVGQLKAEEAQMQELWNARYARFEGQPIDVLAKDPEAVQVGQNIFANNCAACHGSLGLGAVGYPNLTDDDWLWGGSPDQILTTILNGRAGVMPAWGPALAEGNQLAAVSAYTLSLSGGERNELSVRGAATYNTLCVACHGADGKGMQALGAPNLTDNVWLHGSDPAAITRIIAEGKTNQMPPHGPLLGDTRARLAGAYVWSLRPAGQ